MSGDARFKQYLYDKIGIWIEENPHVYVNPNYISEVLGGIDASGYADEVDTSYEIDRWFSDMWGH